MTRYTDSTIEISVPISIDGVAISTSYAANAIMNNPAAGYGICRFTVKKSDGTIATSNGVNMADINCYRHPTESNTAIGKMAYGVQVADEFTILPFYGVKNLDGTLDWRALSSIKVKVYAKP